MNYEGVFFEKIEMVEVLKKIYAAQIRHYNFTENQHITTSFTEGVPTSQTCPNMLDEPVRAKVTAFGYDRSIGMVLEVESVECENNSVVEAFNKMKADHTPHITICVAPGIENKDSYKCLEKGRIPLAQPVYVEGKYSAYERIKEEEQMAYRSVS